MTHETPERQPGRALVSGFSFALLSGLAILSLLIVVMGAKVYRSIDEASDRNHATRTVLSYIAGKVRALDAENAVAVVSLEGRDALVLYEDIEGARYQNCIYFADGGIYECFSAASGEFDPSLGDRLVDVRDFSVKKDGGLLTVSVTDASGAVRSLSLCLQCGEGGNAA